MKTLTILPLVGLLLLSLSAARAEEGLYAMKARSIDGKDVSLSQFKGKVTLVVNTASKCGFTPQYKALQALYDKYSSQGFTVLGFPSNDFHSQEPGSNAEIKKFCEINYGVNFPLFEKNHVIGKEIQPIFQFLTTSPVGQKDGEIGWNFTKFLVDKNGQVVARYSSRVTPSSSAITSKIEALLKQPASSADKSHAGVN